MLQSKKSKIHNPEEMETDYDVAVSPLAITILADLGTIVSAMKYTANSAFVNVGIIIAVIFVSITNLAFLISGK